MFTSSALGARPALSVQHSHVKCEPGRTPGHILITPDSDFVHSRPQTNTIASGTNTGAVSRTKKTSITGSISQTRPSTPTQLTHTTSNSTEALQDFLTPRGYWALNEESKIGIIYTDWPVVDNTLYTLRIKCDLMSLPGGYESPSMCVIVRQVLGGWQHRVPKWLDCDHNELEHTFYVPPYVHRIQLELLFPPVELFDKLRCCALLNTHYSGLRPIQYHLQHTHRLLASRTRTGSTVSELHDVFTQVYVLHHPCTPLDQWWELRHHLTTLGVCAQYVNEYTLRHSTHVDQCLYCFALHNDTWRDYVNLWKLTHRTNFDPMQSTVASAAQSTQEVSHCSMRELSKSSIQDAIRQKHASILLLSDEVRLTPHARWYTELEDHLLHLPKYWEVMQLDTNHTPGATDTATHTPGARSMDDMLGRPAPAPTLKCFRTQQRVPGILNACAALALSGTSTMQAYLSDSTDGGVLHQWLPGLFVRTADAGVKPITSRPWTAGRRVGVIMCIDTQHSVESIALAISSVRAQTYSEWRLVIHVPTQISNTLKVRLEQVSHHDARIQVHCSNEKPVHRYAYLIKQLEDCDFIVLHSPHAYSVPRRFEMQIHSLASSTMASAHTPPLYAVGYTFEHQLSMDGQNRLVRSGDCKSDAAVFRADTQTAMFVRCDLAVPTAPPLPTLNDLLCQLLDARSASGAVVRHVVQFRYQ